MDEVGSGTDPQEGAALARAILDALAGRAALTAATTHHAELKTAADEDGRYVNVSMEFDAATLRPTYRRAGLLGGAAAARRSPNAAAAARLPARLRSAPHPPALAADNPPRACGAAGCCGAPPGPPTRWPSRGRSDST
jgi:hypothetical protein